MKRPNLLRVGGTIVIGTGFLAIVVGLITMSLLAFGIVILAPLMILSSVFIVEVIITIAAVGAWLIYDFYNG